MTKGLLRSFAAAVVLLVLAASAHASWVPDRRKTQFSKEFGYALFPYPYSLPGIGNGLGAVGGAMNINNTTTDAYGILFGGDVKGLAVGVGEIQVAPQHLFMDIGYATVTKATMQSYSKRGMDTNKNDFANAELGDTTYYGARLTSTFFERRFEIYGAWYQGSSTLKSIRQKDGTVIAESSTMPVQRGSVAIVGTRFDLTDDYQDPRRGLRIDVSRSHTPPKDSGPDFYTQDYNATAYLPLGKRSTWAFNYFRSDAHVDRQGDTLDTSVEDELGLKCDLIPDDIQRQFCEDYVKNTVLNNTYGTASSLGGFSRLRSYPNMRFKGAHTIFYGSEIRWNLTDESTPYDIFIMRDVRTSWQISLFYEIGSVADQRSDLGNLWRASTGVGLRMVTASGVVFRADVATGREGIEPSIFIGYPWEL